jgi:hypothetical protein
MDLSDDEAQQHAEADRREVDPPMQFGHVIKSWAAVSVGEGTAVMVGSRPRWRRPSIVDQSR